MSTQDAATAETPGPKLLDLAPEIVEKIIKQVSHGEDLSNVRLACKELDRYAAKELFKSAFLSPQPAQLSIWNMMSQDENIRKIARHAIIHTQADIGFSSPQHDRGDDEAGEEFDAAIATLARFPNLDSVEIGFTPDCVGDREHRYYEEVEEDAARRREVLELIFRAIGDRAANAENRTIRKLTIVNLQNCPLPDFTSSDLFRDVMAQLEELHVTVIQEITEHGPDHDYTHVELQTFPAHLVSAWLQPISHNLKALSIYHRTDNWGPFPGYFDPSALSFPKLETLALGYYTLAHDNDLDWILRIKSLKTLILHNCMIASWIRIDPQNMQEWHVRTHDWVPLPPDDDSWSSASFSYEGKWSQSLDRIAASLPELGDFRFDEGSSWAVSEPSTLYALKHRYTCGARVFPERYVCFDNGILPSHWLEADDGGDIESWLDEGWPKNVHEETLEEDQKSLDSLLDACRSRSQSAR